MLEWFLSVNSLGAIVATDHEIVEFCLSAENDKWSIDDIEHWLRVNVGE